MADQPVETFRVRFLSVFLLIVSIAGIGVFGLVWFEKRQGRQLDPVAAAAAGVGVAVVGAAWTRRLVNAYPVVLGPGGLRAYGLRGGPAVDVHWLEWKNVVSASRFSIPFVPCLVLRTRTSRRRCWVPLALEDAARFRDRVLRYAGRMHPVTRLLYD